MPDNLINRTESRNIALSDFLHNFQEKNTGYLNPENEEYAGQEEFSTYWTSFPFFIPATNINESQFAIARIFPVQFPAIQRSYFFKQFGFAIRCLKD